MSDLRVKLGALDLDSPECHANVKEFIPTGIPTFDIITGRGGIPVGRTISLVGEPGTGKSSLVYSILATTQRLGGIAVLVDSEYSLEADRARVVGLNTDELIKFEDVHLEQIVPLIENVIKLVRAENPDKLLCIALDTCSALASESDLSMAEGKSTQPGIHARYFSQAFRGLVGLIAKSRVALILVHQPRTKIMTMGYGSPLTWLAKNPTTFYSSMIFQLARFRYIKQGQEPIGIEVKAKNLRNKLAPPLKTCNFFVRFDSGVDGISPMLDILVLSGKAKKKGGWYTLTGDVKVQANTFRDYYREHSEQVDLWVKEAMETITDSSMAEVEEPEVE
jgi:recombination protein RecA